MTLSVTQQWLNLVGEAGHKYPTTLLSNLPSGDSLKPIFSSRL